MMIAIGMLAVNLIVFGIQNGGTQIDSTVLIIIVSVAVGILAIPILLFFGFHIYLNVTGRTTRELIKKIDINADG